jgi:hypothetical protein
MRATIITANDFLAQDKTIQTQAERLNCGDIVTITGGPKE